MAGDDSTDIPRVSPPGVSIVIPSYNYACYVAAAIRSALSQDHPNVEVIVVDDGSDDDSRDVIDEFGSAVRTIYQRNSGRVHACNVGWHASRNELVIFLDADDTLSPSCASTVCRAWTPRASKVQYCLSVMDETGRQTGHVFPKYPRRMSPSMVREELLRTSTYNWAPGSGNAYSRWLLEALDPIQPDTSLDNILSMAAPLYGDVVTVNQVLAQYRVHDANGSFQKDLSVQRFQSYLDDEKRRAQYVADHCARLGITFDPEAALDKSADHQEHQLVVARLGGARAGGRLLLLRAWRVGRTALASSQSSWQRWLRAGWALLVACAPERMARRFIAVRYIATQRPRLVEVIAEGLRPRGRPSPSRDVAASPTLSSSSPNRHS